MKRGVEWSGVPDPLDRFVYDAWRIEKTLVRNVLRPFDYIPKEVEPLEILPYRSGRRRVSLVERSSEAHHEKVRLLMKWAERTSEIGTATRIQPAQ